MKQVWSQVDGKGDQTLSDSDQRWRSRLRHLNQITLGRPGCHTLMLQVWVRKGVSMPAKASPSGHQAEDCVTLKCTFYLCHQLARVMFWPLFICLWTTTRKVTGGLHEIWEINCGPERVDEIRTVKLMQLKFLMQVQSSWLSKGNCLCKNMSYNVQKDLSTRFFAQLSHFQPPEFCTLQCCLVGQTSPKVLLSMRASTRRVIHVPLTHPTLHPKLHLDRFSRFCTAYGTVSLYFTMCIKTWLMRNLKK